MPFLTLFDQRVKFENPAVLQTVSLSAALLPDDSAVKRAVALRGVSAGIDLVLGLVSILLRGNTSRRFVPIFASSSFS